MSKRMSFLIGVTIAAGLGLSAVPGQTGEVKVLGRTSAQFTDEHVRVAVDWIDLALRPQERWGFIEIWLMPLKRDSIKIRREDISLVLPDGTRLTVPGQAELTAGLPDIRRIMAMTDVPRERLGNTFRPRKSTQRFGFHEVPGTPQMTFDSCTVGQLSAGYGDVFFANPRGAWEDGTYRLEIKNGEIDAAIPFSLGPVSQK
jgi:hypothetical protein